jgi:hypothetical protein
VGAGAAGVAAGAFAFEELAHPAGSSADAASTVAHNAAVTIGLIT